MKTSKTGVKKAENDSHYTSTVHQLSPAAYEHELGLY